MASTRATCHRAEAFYRTVTTSNPCKKSLFFLLSTLKHMGRIASLQIYLVRNTSEMRLEHDELSVL